MTLHIWHTKELDYLFNDLNKSTLQPSNRLQMQYTFSPRFNRNGHELKLHFPHVLDRDKSNPPYLPLPKGCILLRASSHKVSNFPREGKWQVHNFRLLVDLLTYCRLFVRNGSYFIPN